MRPLSVMNLRNHSAFFQSTGVVSSITRRRRPSSMFVSPYTMNVAYQLDFLTPGISPRNANKRKSMRDMPNRLRNPRVRPEIRHRFLTRLGLALRGSACSSRCASIRSSKEDLGFRITSFRFARWCTYRITTSFRFSFLMMQLFLAIGPSFPQGVKL